MDNIEWKDLFLTNIPEIDLQHKKLIEVLNKVLIAQRENNTAEVKEIFVQLIQYSQYHFEFEENHMQFNRYKKLSEHKLEHQYYIKQIQNLLLSLKEGKEDILSEIKEMLEKWLINHICSSDREYAKTIKKVV